MRRKVGRMRSAVHPNRPRLFVGADVVLDCDDLLGFGVLFLPDAELQRTVVDVGSDVHAALMLLQRQARGVPALGKQACRIIDRESGVIPQVRAGAAVLLVFMGTKWNPRA